MFFKLKMISVVALCALSMQVLAASTQSTKTIKSPNFLDKIKPDGFGYWSSYTGPSVGDLNDRNNIDGTVDQGDMDIAVFTSAKWRINDDYKFVFGPRFKINLVPTEQPGGKPDKNVLEYDSPVIGVSSTWWKSGKWTFTGGINTIVPFLRDDGDRNDGRIFNPGGFNIFMYQATPAVQVGSWLWGRVAFFNKSQAVGTERIETQIAPYISYSFNDKHGVQVIYSFETDTAFNAADDLYSEFTQEDEQIMLVYKYVINNMFTLEPNISLYKLTDYELAKGNIQVWISGKFF